MLLSSVQLHADDLKRKMHTKSLDGQKGTPDDRVANVLNFSTNQKESSFKMPIPETVYKMFNFFPANTTDLVLN